MADELPIPCHPSAGSLRDACTRELHNIANWWRDHAVDARGGFWGEIANNGDVVPEAEKGIILNARILWFFSELCLHLNTGEYRNLADRAFNYLLDHFDDKLHGGVYWSVSCLGKPASTKKHIYAQAFAIYALSAYYRVSRNAVALEKALTYFNLIETHACDRQYGGYIEAFTAQWQSLSDLRLSTKDDNVPKTMNNHLHILEAYTGLYRAHKTPEVASALRYIIDIFIEKFVIRDTNHLRLFMDMQWNDHSKFYSYGHDIEASWLLYEALVVLGDPLLLGKHKALILALANTCMVEGIGNHGEVVDRFDIATRTRHNHSEWWIQTEAMVGFLNAWQITGNDMYLHAVEKTWSFIQTYHLDPVQGEWFWYSTLDQKAGFNQYKVGFWKAPYHNGRAMMEVINRLKSNVGFYE